PAEAGTALTADGIKFIDEDHRRRVLLGVFEETADAGRADADEHLDELRGRDAEKWHPRLAGDGTRQQRLTGPRRANEQNAFGHPAAELLELLRIAQEIDHLLQLELRLLHPGDVVECRLGGGWILEAGAAAAKAENALRRLTAPSHEPDPDGDQHDERQETNEQAPQPTRIWLDGGSYVVALQGRVERRVGQANVVGEGRGELRVG